MSAQALHSLLEMLREGRSDAALVDAARALLEESPLAGTDMLETVFVDDVRGDAALLLELLQDRASASGSLLAAALRSEATSDAGLVEEIMGAVHAEPTVSDVEAPAIPEVADAVRDEAGELSEDLGREYAELPALAEAIRAEAGRLAKDFGVDYAALTSPIAEAVRGEAGTVDVVEQVMAQLGTHRVGEQMSAMFDGELRGEARAALAKVLLANPALQRELTLLADLSREVREAVSEERGPVPYMWEAIGRGMGLEAPEEVPGFDGASVTAALRAEAGPVDVADAVMDAILRQDVVEEPDVPEAISQQWGIAATLVIAAAAMLMVLPQWIGEVDPADTSTAPAAPLMAELAKEGEVEVLEISADEEAVFGVIPADGDGPLIIWVDDGAQL